MTYSWYGDYILNVLLSATLGASQDGIGEHGALIVAVGNALTGQQAEKECNVMTLHVMLCEFTTYCMIVANV